MLAASVSHQQVFPLIASGIWPAVVVRFGLESEYAAGGGTACRTARPCFRFRQTGFRPAFLKRKSFADHFILAMNSPHRPSQTHSDADDSAANLGDPCAVILAAGKGTRMKSDLPKVLCPVVDRAMIHFVIDALE
mgnify:CR=1 FL=1